MSPRGPLGVARGRLVVQKDDSDVKVEMVGGARGSWLRRSMRRDILEQKRLKRPF